MWTICTRLATAGSLIQGKKCSDAAVNRAAHDAPQPHEIFQHPIIHVGEDQLAISRVHRYLEEAMVDGEEVADE